MGTWWWTSGWHCFFQGGFGSHLPLRPRVGDRSPYSEGAQVGRRRHHEAMVSLGNVWNIFDGKRWCFKLLIRCACGSTIGCFSLDLASNREMIGDADWLSSNASGNLGVLFDCEWQDKTEACCGWCICHWGNDMDGGDRVASWEAWLEINGLETLLHQSLAKLQILGGTPLVSVSVLSCAKLLRCWVPRHGLGHWRCLLYWTTSSSLADCGYCGSRSQRTSKSMAKYGMFMSVSRRHHEKQWETCVFHCVSGKLLCKNYLLFLFCFWRLHGCQIATRVQSCFNVGVFL